MPLNLYSAGKVDDLLSVKLSVSSLSNAATSTLNATAPTAGQALTFDGTDLVWATVGGGGGGASWGSITGTLSSQTDLWTALSALAPTAGPSFTGTVSITGSWGSVTIGDSTTGSLALYNGSQTTTYAASGITFPDSTVQTTAATYDAKKAIANLAASCFTTNGSTIGFTNYIAAAVAQGSKFQSSSAYVLGIGTPGYGPTTLTLTYSSATWADSGVSWGSFGGQAIAYSDDYGTTWTYSDLTF